MDLACRAPLPTVFPKQEYWSEVPFPSPGDLPDPGIEHMSLAWQVDSLSKPPGKPRERRSVCKSGQLAQQ